MSLIKLEKVHEWFNTFEDFKITIGELVNRIRYKNHKIVKIEDMSIINKKCSTCNVTGFINKNIK